MFAYRGDRQFWTESAIGEILRLSLSAVLAVLGCLGLEQVLGENEKDVRTFFLVFVPVTSAIIVTALSSIGH